MYFDTSTILNQLSAQVHQRFQEIISNSEFYSTLQALSAAPSHPYERLKWQLFGEDYKFPTINDIEIPEDFDPVTYAKQLSSCSQQTYNAAFSGFQGLSADSAFNIPECTTPLTTTKHSIQFMEIVRSLTVQDIQNNPVEIARKLASYYVKNYQ